MITKTALLVGTAIAAAAIAVAPAAGADDEMSPRPCSKGQFVMDAAPTGDAGGHRAVALIFELALASEPCTLTGYPGVDSGTGGPLIHAQRTLRGYMGGLPASVDTPPTVVLSLGHPARAIVESVAVDADGNPCPTYTDLRVTAPDSTRTYTLKARIEACALQVHPVTATP